MGDQQLQERACQCGHPPVKHTDRRGCAYCACEFGMKDADLSALIQEHPGPVLMVPRADADALAEALERVNLVNPPAALAAYRSRYPKETP
jgi:hypothetical protein